MGSTYRNIPYLHTQVLLVKGPRSGCLMVVLEGRSEVRSNIPHANTAG